MYDSSWSILISSTKIFKILLNTHIIIHTPSLYVIRSRLCHQLSIGNTIPAFIWTHLSPLRIHLLCPLFTLPAMSSLLHLHHPRHHPPSSTLPNVFRSHSLLHAWGEERVKSYSPSQLTWVQSSIPSLVRATALQLRRAVAARPLDRTRVMSNNEGRICDSERGVSVFATPLMTLTTVLDLFIFVSIFEHVDCWLGPLPGAWKAEGHSVSSIQPSPSLFSPSLFSPPLPPRLNPKKEGKNVSSG